MNKVRGLNGLTDTRGLVIEDVVLESKKIKKGGFCMLKRNRFIGLIIIIFVLSGTVLAEVPAGFELIKNTSLVQGDRLEVKNLNFEITKPGADWHFYQSMYNSHFGLASFLIHSDNLSFTIVLTVLSMDSKFKIDKDSINAFKEGVSGQGEKAGIKVKYTSEQWREYPMGEGYEINYNYISQDDTIISQSQTLIFTCKNHSYQFSFYNSPESFPKNEVIFHDILKTFKYLQPEKPYAEKVGNLTGILLLPLIFWLLGKIKIFKRKETIAEAKKKRPGIITFICILGFIGTVISIVYMLTLNLVKSWDLIISIGIVLITLICLVGLWKMKKWSIITYTILYAVSQVFIFIRFDDVNKGTAVLIPALAIAIGFTYFSDMT